VRGVDGQFTVRTPAGMKTLAYERGVAASLTHQSLTVHAADGTTWTWLLTPRTVVRDRVTRRAESTVPQGAEVWVGGTVTNGSKDARLVVINPPSPAAPRRPAPQHPGG
jgi:hypothetical protein